MAKTKNTGSLSEKDLTLKIMGMKKGQSFIVKTPLERSYALRIAKILRHASVIGWKLLSDRGDNGGFTLLRLDS